MTTCVGCVLLFAVISGGIYLYFKVERLDREIGRHVGDVPVEGEDESV